MSSVRLRSPAFPHHLKTRASGGPAALSSGLGFVAFDGSWLLPWASSPSIRLWLGDGIRLDALESHPHGENVSVRGELQPIDARHAMIAPLVRDGSAVVDDVPVVRTWLLNHR